MVKKSVPPESRTQTLSRDRIIDAAIQLLDSAGEGGLTFRALSERLATGPGAIYWHIANKDDLILAACDRIVVDTMQGLTERETPADALRDTALGFFDAIDEHPWMGAALVQAAGQSPTIRLFERVGRQVQALGVAPTAQWAATSALMHYVLGVGSQNSANRLYAQKRGINRDSFLSDVSTAWSSLDEKNYPFARSMAAAMRDHDDRDDFLAGVDLILRGIQALT